MKHFLGIDIGGTNVKFGVVSEEGELLNKVKHPTAKVAAEGEFVKNFIKLLGEQLSENPSISKVGIGIPGTISLDRKSLMELANIPSLNGIALIPALEKEFPNHQFYLENDANAAALGEYYFGTHSNLPESYFFLTLGTGVGGAAIIEKKIFKGGDGNGMEIGHIISSKGETIEAHLGKKGTIKLAKKLIKEDYPNSILHNKGDFDAKAVAKAAHKGDTAALKVYHKLGKYVGEAIVAGARILDAKTVIIGGGVSETFDYMKPNMMKVIHKYLTPYYTKNLRIELASLRNEAGIIGAASLCFMD